MSCLFEPIHGRFPTNSICDSYPDCVGCSYSDPFKQPKKTNADRIRAMSDEELAEFIGRCVDHEFQFECVCFLNQFGYCQYPTRGCNENALEWLKEEVE